MLEEWGLFYRILFIHSFERVGSTVSSRAILPWGPISNINRRK